MKKLSKITDKLIGQPMFGLLARAKKMETEGKKIIHFEIGDPNFNSPPKAIQAAKNALDANLTHYTDSSGMKEFKEAIINYTESNWGFRPSMNQILVCPANTLIDFVIRCAVNPGDEVIYPDPSFPTYNSVMSYNGIVPVGIQLKEEDGFRMNPDEIRKKITDKTRLIILNTPQNPTGSVMTKEDVLEIAKIAKEHDIYLLSDEVYFKITYDKTHFSPVIADQCNERAILLVSLSKMYSMSGWRLGYAIGPEKLIEKMGLLSQTILSCLPAFTQFGGKIVLSENQDFLIERNEELRKRRDLLINGLNKLSGISCPMPQGAFYAFPSIKNTGMSSDEYCERLLEDTGVCVLPGNCFGKCGEDYVRFSYASTSIELIEEALEKMKKFHEKFNLGEFKND